MSKTTFEPFVLLAIGFLLALFKMLYLFIDYYNVLDLVVFCIAGYFFSRKLPPNRLGFTLLVALPAFALCLYIAIGLGYSSIVQGIGTAYAVSLILIPVATLVGIFIRFKRMQKSAL